ncbi:MAG: pentapeptide repeat-containing protein [Proteobacteria bacterium]|nr:pentapeptide repeat-containing protein [Pseudomonadota bacterium]
MAGTDAEQAEKALEAANEASRTAGRTFFLFLLVALYFAILIGTTTDEQLLRESAITLPLLNVGLPIVWSYAIGPWLLVLLHFHLLLQHYLLSRKLSAFDKIVQPLYDHEREAFLNRISSYPFSQAWTSAPESVLVRGLLRLIVWVTFLVIPVLLMLWAQARFLPYQHQGFTWNHRIVLSLDVVLTFLFLWPLIRWTGKGGHIRQALRWIGTTAILITSVLIAVFPGERFDAVPWFRTIAEAVFDSDYFPFRRHLDIREKTLVAVPPSPELVANFALIKSVEEAYIDQATGLDLRGRSFRKANFERARLYQANLEDAVLTNANLCKANLDGANLTRTDFRGAKLAGANLKGADWINADWRGADLTGTMLDGETFAEECP